MIINEKFNAGEVVIVSTKCKLIKRKYLCMFFNLSHPSLWADFDKTLYRNKLSSIKYYMLLFIPLLRAYLHLSNIKFSPLARNYGRKAINEIEVNFGQLLDNRNNNSRFSLNNIILMLVLKASAFCFTTYSLVLPCKDDNTV